MLNIIIINDHQVPCHTQMHFRKGQDGGIASNGTTPFKYIYYFAVKINVMAVAFARL